MRKITVILLTFLLCAVLSRAENVSPERAAAAAESFFASVSTKSAAGPVTLVATFPDIPTKARGERHHFRRRRGCPRNGIFPYRTFPAG